MPRSRSPTSAPTSRCGWSRCPPPIRQICCSAGLSLVEPVNSCCGRHERGTRKRRPRDVWRPCGRRAATVADLVWQQQLDYFISKPSSFGVCGRWESTPSPPWRVHVALLVPLLTTIESAEPLIRIDMTAGAGDEGMAAPAVLVGGGALRIHDQHAPWGHSTEPMLSHSRAKM